MAKVVAENWFTRGMNSCSVPWMAFHLPTFNLQQYHAAHPNPSFCQSVNKAEEYIKLIVEIRPDIDMNAAFRLTLSQTNMTGWSV